MKEPTKRYGRHPIWFLAALVLAGEGLKRNPDWIEAVFSDGVYPVLSRVMNHIFGLLPFSVFELIVWALVIGLLTLSAVGILRLIQGNGGTAPLPGLMLRGATVLLAGILLFEGLWGFNYYRRPLADQLHITVRSHSKEELAALCRVLIQEANSLSGRVHRNEAGVMVEPAGADSVFRRAPAGYAQLGAVYPAFRIPYRGPKGVLYSEGMSWAGIMGIYSPFTAEAQVNRLIPAYFLPFTALHEMGHLYGFAREDEANFLGWLACRSHPDPDFRYSGALMGAVYAMNALYEADPKLYRQVRDTYASAVRLDLDAGNAFWRRYQGPVEETHEKINDRYLKANGQADGTRSYGRMVDLLLESGQLNQSAAVKTP